MDIYESLRELETMKVGFNLKIAERKSALILEILNFLESNYETISSDNKQRILEQTFGFCYELGQTKQQFEPNLEKNLMLRVLPFARLFYGKTDALIPYLNASANYVINDSQLHRELKEEINEIESLNKK